MGWKNLRLAATAVALIGAAPTPDPTPPSPPPPLQGYLGKTGPDTYKILPPAPAPGSPRWEADRTIFKATRSYQGSPRWTLAQVDADQPAFVKDLSCAVGVDLTAAAAPRLKTLLRRMALDSTYYTNYPKDIYRRPRPFVVDPGPTCVKQTPLLAASPDYPSGHTTWSWAVGLVMAELAPDRSTQILQRARAFGESRLVCGVHYLSAVEAGRMNASIMVAGLHGVAEFRADLEAVRSEVAAAPKAGPAPSPDACAAEAALIAKSPH
jgi:acid phosphatase (class A)